MQSLRYTTNSGGYMEECEMRKIIYATSYDLLKRFVGKGIIDEEQFEQLNIIMADCQMCDPLISHNCGID